MLTPEQLKAVENATDEVWQEIIRQPMVVHRTGLGKSWLVEAYAQTCTGRTQSRLPNYGWVVRHPNAHS